MNWNRWTRRLHRLLSISFTAGVAFNIVAVQGGEEPRVWIYLLAGVPLALLWLSGACLFLLSYVTKQRCVRRAVESTR